MKKQISFRITRHDLRKVDVVEVLVDGNTAAVIYPGTDEGQFMLVSAHFKRIDMLDGPASPMAPIPVVNVTLDPQPFEIVGGKLVKHIVQ